MKKTVSKLPKMVYVGRPYYQQDDLNVSEDENVLVDTCQEKPGDIVLVGVYQLVSTEKRSLGVRTVS